MSDTYDLLTTFANMKQKLDEAGGGGNYEILTNTKLPKHEKLGSIHGIEVIACPLYASENEAVMVQAGNHEKLCPLGHRI